MVPFHKIFCHFLAASIGQNRLVPPTPHPSPTMHVNITLANDQLDAQISFNTFITILYMFRAISCSSSGRQIVLIQHLVLSLSVSDRPVHSLRKNSVLQRTVINVLKKICASSWSLAKVRLVPITKFLGSNLQQ